MNTVLSFTTKTDSINAEAGSIVTASDLRWLRLALQQAERSTHSKWKVGAVVVRGGSVLGKGSNKYRNDPAFVHHHDVSYHAEAVAIKKAGGNVAGATIYVARITSGGNLGLAKPCLRCQNLLDDHSVHSAIWTVPTGMQKLRISELVLETASHRRAS